MRAWSGVALAAALIIPTALNCSVGERLGIWWAPFPMWIFILAVAGVPRLLLVLIPSILFGVTAWLKPAPRVVMGILIAAAITHLSWAIAFSSEGLMRVGALYVFGVQTLGAALLVASAVLLRKNALIALWLVFLWLAWVSMPWFSEAP